MRARVGKHESALLPVRERLALRGLALLFGTALAHAGLVATHGGEFWPFSLYPMFSRAGRPWTRALVRRVPPESLLRLQRVYSLAALPGEPLALDAIGIPQNDLSSIVQRAEVPRADDRAAALALFRDLPCQSGPFVVFSVSGALTADAVVETAVPVLTLTCGAAGAVVAAAMNEAPR